MIRAVALALRLLAIGCAVGAWEGRALAAEGAGGSAPAEGEPLPLVKNPELREFVEATYPEAARTAGVEGSVGLAITIEVDGTVSAAEVIRAAGNGFDEAAVEAARKLKFAPAEDATGPVPVILEFEYGFVLDAAAHEGAVPVETRTVAMDAPVNLDGLLTEMGTQRPLVGFVVRLEPSGVEATTDAEGRYAFRGVAAGACTLKVLHPGFDALQRDVEVVAGQVTSVRLWLRNTNYQDEGIVGLYRRESADVTRRTITFEEIRRIPGTFGDPIRVIQNLPGAARAPLGSGLLIIRGANPEDSGVYVDGIRIPYIFHLGGFESVINPDLVGAVDYLPGGFGPRYGRSTGGAVDVSSRQEFPERIQARWSTDALDSGLLVMGSLGKDDQHGFGLAARRSYIDAFLPLFLGDGFVAIPQWWDYQAKYQSQGKGKWRASALAFGFQDTLFVHTPEGYSQGSDQDTQGDVYTEYGTHRVMATLEGDLGNNLRLFAAPSFGNDYRSFTLGNSFGITESRWIMELRAELTWAPSDHVTALAGIDFIGGWSDFSIEFPFNPQSFADTDPTAEREAWTIEDTVDGWGPDPYVGVELRPLADPEALLVAPGVRFMYIIVPGEFTTTGWDPRLAARWRPYKSGMLKASAGLYHQPPQTFQMYRSDDKHVDLGAEQSAAVSLGIEQQVTQAIRFEVEGFYKDLSNLIVNNTDFETLDDQFFTNEGLGRVYGVEVMLRHEPVNRLFGWISYTLSRSERQDHPGEPWYPFDFDQAHILVGLAGYHFPYDIDVSLKGQYTTGNPYTPYALGVYDVDADMYNAFSSGDYNSERLAPYWAFSARIDKLFTFRRWQLDLYLDLLNVLHGTNPEFQVYNYDYTESVFVEGLPFIPSPGFEARFEF